ncbi:MAG: hypothetical protein GY738_01670, partial [Pseudoalteromonas sp.]|nr:hypothetical protein [Pseudoalteromonas sp.]
KQLRKVEDNFKRVGGNILKAGAGFTAFGAALVAPLVAATKSFVDFGDTIDKISARTGASAEFISALGFAAEQSGADIQTLEKAIIGQQRTINDLNQGLATAADSYEALGLSAKDLVGLGVEESFTLIAQRLSQVEDPSKRAATALEIFGKAGQRLIPLLNGGEAAIKSYIDQANKAGLVVNQQDAKAAADLADALNLAQRALRGLQLKIGASLAKQFTLAIDKITEYVVKAQKFIEANKGLVKSALQIGAGLAGAGVALTAIGLSFIALGSAVGAFATIVSTSISILGSLAAAITTVGGVLVTFLASPLSTIVILVGSLVAATNDLKGQLIDLAGAAQKDLGNAFLNAKDNFDLLKRAVLAGDLKLAFQILATSIKLFFLEAFDSILDKWTDYVTATRSGLNNVITTFKQAASLVKGYFLEVALVLQQTGDAVVSAFTSPLTTLQNLFVRITTRIKLLWVDIKGLIEAGIEISSGSVSGAKEVLEDVLKEREEIKKQAEEKIQLNLDLDANVITSDSTKAIQEAIRENKKSFSELADDANDFTLGLFKASDESKAARDEATKKLQDQLKSLGLEVKKAEVANKQKTASDKRATEETRQAFKSIVPKFGQLAEAGSSAAIKLFGSPNNPLVKEQRQANKILSTIAENTDGLTVR